MVPILYQKYPVDTGKSRSVCSRLAVGIYISTYKQGHVMRQDEKQKQTGVWKKRYGHYHKQSSFLIPSVYLSCL